MKPTTPKPMTAEMERAYEACCKCLDANRLKTLLYALTDIHSPTGATRAASEFMVQHLNQLGLPSKYMGMNDISGNVLGELKGAGTGATLLLYAPIDTHLEGDDSDLPWAGPTQEVDMRPEAKLVDDWVYGLGSSNPKAMVATLTEVANAVVDSGIEFKGNLNIAFADGGMPVNVPSRDNAGMSNGIEHLLNRGLAPDFCIIMKPWIWVYHEEPGMGWFKITVHGTLGYAGVPRGTPGFRSSIVPAAELITNLEAWLQEYTQRNTSGVVRPDGWISALRSGWPDRPAFPSAATEIFFDVRINPRTSPAEVKAQFAEFMRSFCIEHPDTQVDWEMYGSVPGGTTDPDNWIVQSARRGWERVEEKAYSDPDLLGGQTDGAAIRRLGIPTARLGWPWPAENSPERVAEGLGGMGATYVPDLMPCARKILYALIDTLMRDRQEVVSTEV